MAEQKMMPEIRFQGFDAEWIQNPLEKYGYSYTGLSGKRKYDFGHGSACYITYMSVLSNARNSGESNCNNYIEIDPQQNEVEVGDVFFTTSSETPEEVGMSSVLLKKTGITYLNSFCFGFRPVKKFDLNFLAYLLRSNSVRKKIIVLAQGISRYNISKHKLMAIDISSPNLIEQYKIGEYLCKLDNLITFNKNKSQKLLTLKKSMLDKMFPKPGKNVPEIRFKGFDGEWNVRKLGEFSTKCTEKNIRRLVTETFTNSAEHGVLSQLDYFDHDITNDANIDGYYIVHPDDFVYNPRISVTAPCGPINRNCLNRCGVMSPLYTVFAVNESICKLYLEYFFKTNLWHPFMFLEGNSGARSDRFSISDSIFFEMPICCPTLKEQQAIAKYFDRLDSLISLHQTKYQKLLNLKKSLLSKMFV